MSDKLTVLVTGVTGKQGGAVARSLLARGHKVRGLTRKPENETARNLAGLGVEIVAGELTDAVSVSRAAQGADTIFLMGTPYEAGMAAETEQGISAIEALKTTAPGHVIYASVDSVDRHTGIPHFESKFLVEEHLVASGLPYTISAPVAFMENHVAPWVIGGLLGGTLAMALPPNRKLKQIAVADIGDFVASLVERRQSVFGRRIDIAGDDLTGEQMAAHIARASGREIRYQEAPLAVLRQQNEDAAIMFEWFDRVGYSADIPALRREFPEVRWRTFAEWANEFDWDALPWPEHKPGTSERASAA